MMSLKKLIAVLATSLPLAAMAQQAAAPAAPPLAQIYGTLNLNLQNTGTSGAPVTTIGGQENNIQGRWSVSADSSNIGVKGTANVAGGFGVVYQCESSAKVDGVGTIGNPVTSAVTLCDRNSRLGLSHPVYGTLFLGNWDTPFKAAYYGTKADDPFGSTDVFGANNILGSPGNATKSGNLVQGFDIRATNSVAYWSPKVSGFALRAQVQVNENAANRFHGTPGTATAAYVDPWIFGGALNYDMGPLSAVVAYEQHRDAHGLTSMFAAATGGAANAGAASRDDAWRIAAGYEVPLPIGPLTLAATWEQLAYTSRISTANALQGYTRRAVRVSGKQRYGDHEFRAQFIWADRGTCKFSENPAGAAQDCDAIVAGRDAKQYTLGYAYYLAASTQVYLFWNRIANDQGATYVPGAGGSFSGPPAIYNLVAGADPESFGLGMRYAF
jgi:predicted porin